MFASHIHWQYQVWCTGSPQKMRGHGTQTISFGNSSAGISASVACVFAILIVTEWNTNTLSHTALSICYSWRVWRMWTVIKNGQFSDLQKQQKHSFFFFLNKGCIFQVVSARFYLCMQVCVSFPFSFNLKAVFHSPFLLAALSVP